MTHLIVGTDRDNNPREYKNDISGYMPVMSIEHSRIHDGLYYSAFTKQTISAAGSLEFSFKTPTTGFVHFRPTGISPSADKVDTQIYEGATINANGTTINILNRNRLSANVSSADLRYGTTFTVPGTLLDAFSSWLPGSTGVGQSRAGDSKEGGDEIILKQNTVYRFVCTNGSSSSNIIGFNFGWYEI